MSLGKDPPRSNVDEKDSVDVLARQRIQECSCRKVDKIRIMLLSTSMLMRWNGRWAGSRTGRSFSFIRVQTAPPSQMPALFGMSPERVIPSTDTTSRKCGTSLRAKCAAAIGFAVQEH